MFEAAKLIRPDVRRIAAYEPILPFEVLSLQLGLPAHDIVKLDANENPYGPLPAVGEALAQLPYAHVYPDPESRQLCEALAAYHGIPVETVMAGAGADELIDLIMRLFLEPNDAILNCPPTFGMYSFDAAVNGARVITVQRHPTFALDLDAITAAVRQHHPKLLFLASPNNPDGSLLPAEELERLLTLPLVLVLDEAYVEFAPSGSSRIRDVAAHQNLIVLRTFSKWAGLAGLRLGYGVFPASLMAHMWKIKQPYNVSVAAAVAGCVSLQHADQLNERVLAIRSERERLYQALHRVSWLEPFPSQANFVLCRVKERDAATVKADLARAGILIRYYDKPGLRDLIRISVGTPEHMDAVTAQLSEWG